jgi:hypothetical protein
MSQTRRLAAILSTDAAGYSRLIGADGGGTLRRLRAIRDELVPVTAIPKPTNQHMPNPRRFFSINWDALDHLRREHALARKEGVQQEFEGTSPCSPIICPAPPESRAISGSPQPTRVFQLWLPLNSARDARRSYCR